jgi:deoxyribonuclease V
MKLPAPIHGWDLTPGEAVVVQRELSSRVRRSRAPGLTLARSRHIAGLDAAFSADGQSCIAGVVLWDAAAQQVVEQHVVCHPLRFPYVPGLLSFREAPALLAALAQLQQEPDVLMFDGQGIAHPRRVGLASHVGLFVARPSIGCAKSRLVGTHEEPGPDKGAWTALMDADERIGAVLRSRTRIKPIYISIGHLVDLRLAITLTLRCCLRYRLPEPTRLADKLVARGKAGLARVGATDGRAGAGPMKTPRRPPGSTQC